jgi:nucleotidyltransferase/DNA polymerase involved in DNA repair
MPIVTAERLCPQAVFLPVRMKHHAEIGRHIRSILLCFTPLVEPLSLDAAFLDVGGCEGLFGPAQQMARTIRRPHSLDRSIEPRVRIVKGSALMDAQLRRRLLEI